MDTMKHFRMHSKVKVVGSWRLRCGKQAILYNVPQDYMICLRIGTRVFPRDGGAPFLFFNQSTHSTVAPIVEVESAIVQEWLDA